MTVQQHSCCTSCPSGRRGNRHLAEARFLHWGGPCPPQTPPQSFRRPKAAFSPLVVVGARRFAAFVGLRFPAARLPGSPGGGTGSLALPLLQSWAPLVGRELKLPILVRRRCSSPASPLKGRSGELCSSSLSTGGSSASPRPPSNRQRALQALFLHWWFSVASRSRRCRHRQFSDARPPNKLGGRHRELPLPPPSSLATSRWVPPVPLVPMATLLAWLPVVVPTRL